jgi:hypothetical protein
MCVVLDEAEAAGCLLETIEAHDEALDFTAPYTLVSIGLGMCFVVA